MFDCYNNVVGLTNKDCACTNANRPVDYNTSLSGLFLSQLVEIDSLINLGKCDDNMWTILTDSMAAATRRLVSETNALLQKNYSLKRKPALQQFIGEIKAKDTVSPTKTYGVVRINCCPIRSGYMKINSIGTVFSDTGTVSVGLYNNVDGLLSTHVLNTTANKNTKNVLNLELPTFSKYVDTLEYYLVYDFDIANLPKDTEVDCGCGGWSPRFNLDAPHYLPRYAGQVSKKFQWTKYAMVGGLQIDDLAALNDLSFDEDFNSLENNMYGLNLEVDFSCKISETLCKDSLDFTGNPLALSLATALMYLTAMEVANKVSGSTVLSREIMINLENWEESAQEWNEKYIEHVEFIVKSVDLSGNDCLTCKDVLEMTRQGLFS